MTDNQERAKVELQRYAQLQSELRILELKHDSALDECQPGASWPDVGVAKGEWPDPTTYKMDDGTTLKLSKKVASIPRGTNRMHGGQILSTVEIRRRLETQMRVIHEQMHDMETLVRARCDAEDAEVLISNFMLGQSWSMIAERLEIGRSTVRRRYLCGLECFGAKMNPNEPD